MKTSAKQSVNLRVVSSRPPFRYKVASLTNRLEPVVGTNLTQIEVETLIGEANRPFSKLTVNIKE